MFDSKLDDLEVVHEDAHLLALVKPAGLLAVPGRGSDKADCLITRAHQRWPDALVVHRLDQATSGLMLLARGLAMQRALSAAFAERRVRKHYQALVHGRADLPADADAGWAEIDLPLLIDWPNRPRSAVNHAAGKPSRTRWRPVAWLTALRGRFGQSINRGRSISAQAASASAGRSARPCTSAW